VKEQSVNNYNNAAMLSTHSLSVIVPAYNEAKKIGSTIETIRSFLKKARAKDFEIIVVDDGSSDGTGKIALQHKAKLLSNKRNRGKGYSVKRGILASKKELVLFTDVDLSTPLPFLKKFLPYLGQYDIVIASRSLPKSKIKSRGLVRNILGRGFANIVSIVVLPGIKDSQCGFKLFKAGCAKKVFELQKTDGWAFDVENLAMAKALGFKVKECPIDWYNDMDSRLGPTAIPGMLLDLFKIRFRLLGRNLKKNC